MKPHLDIERKIINLGECFLLNLFDFEDQVLLVESWCAIRKVFPEILQILGKSMRHLNKGLDLLLTMEEYFPACSDTIQDGSVITGAISGKHQVPDQYSYMYDLMEDEKRDGSLRGRSFVIPFPKDSPRLFFKKLPEVPGYEHGVTYCLRKFGVKNVAFSELYSFVDKKNNKYPVLVMNAMEGDFA
jgi:hypothetical protein